MEFLKKITSTKEKYNLYIEIHNLKADFKQECDLMVKIKRGRTQTDKTPAKVYSPAMGEVIFEHSIQFNITAYRNHKNLMQKAIQFKVFRTEKSKTRQDGEVEVELTELAKSGCSLDRTFKRIKGCSDPKAELCISVEMQAVEKSRANSMNDR